MRYVVIYFSRGPLDLTSTEYRYDAHVEWDAIEGQQVYVGTRDDLINAIDMQQHPSDPSYDHKFVKAGTRALFYWKDPT